jgi:small conductance mechanosensitive channel
VFALIVLVSYIVAALVRHIFRRSFSREGLRTSKLMQDMVQAMASRVVLILGVLFGLSQLGLQLGPLLAGLGIAGFIVGFALQDSLANFAAGVMILGYRPFDVDETILTVDNQTLIVPNGKIWGDVIKNVTNQRLRRVDMEFCVSYANDTERTEGILKGIVAADPRVLEDPEPMIKLHELTENGMLFVVRPWVATANYWDVRWDMMREVKRSFDAEGIAIAVPQQEIRFHPTD